MKNDPEQAADRHARAAVMVVFAIVLSVVMIVAFITRLKVSDTRHVSTARSRTIGLAKPHPPLDKANGRTCSKLIARVIHYAKVHGTKLAKGPTHCWPS